MDKRSKAEITAKPPNEVPPPQSDGPSAAQYLEKLSSALRRIYSFPVLLGGLLVSTVFVLAGTGLRDADIWFHLLNGEYVVKNLVVPHVEQYSFTAGGIPWINAEVLSEVLYYLVWRAFGLVGVKALSLVLLELIFTGLLYLCWKESGNVKAAVIACIFAAFLATVSFGPRTILFGYLYLILLLLVLQRFRIDGKAPLWILPPLFCLWINTHGSWSLGLAVFGIVIAGGMAEGIWGRVEAVRWSSRQLRSLLLTLAACIAALFINPYGWRLLLYPLDVGIRQNELIVSSVEEWASVDFHTPRGKVVLILIVGLLLGALLGTRRWKLFEIGFILFGLYTGLTYIRFLIFGAILIAPVLTRILDFIPPYRPELDKPVLNGLLMIAMLAFIVRGFPRAAELQNSVSQDFPAEVLPYLQSHPPSGSVLNSYAWGGYLCWNDRDFKEFIDSRCDIFVYAGTLADYINLVTLKNPKSILDKYGIRYVLIEPSQPLCLLLKQDSNWRTVFDGRVSRMFERVGPAPAAQTRTIPSAEGLKAW